VSKTAQEHITGMSKSAQEHTTGVSKSAQEHTTGVSKPAHASHNSPLTSSTDSSNEGRIQSAVRPQMESGVDDQSLRSNISPPPSHPCGLSGMPGCIREMIPDVHASARRPCTAYGLKQLMCSPILEYNEAWRQLRAVTKRRRINMNEDQENINPVSFKCAAEIKKDREMIKSLFISGDPKPKTLQDRAAASLEHSGKENDVPSPCRSKRAPEQEQSQGSAKKCKLGEGCYEPTLVLTTSPIAAGVGGWSSAQKILLRRSHSDMKIKSALQCAGERQDLIGDLSRPYRLPMIFGKHADLKAITDVTVCVVTNSLRS